MIDLFNKLERGRLNAAIKASRQAMEPFCKVRTELIRDYVGSWYSSSGARCQTLVNLMNQTARTYARLLAANNPKVKITTTRLDLWPFAKRFEICQNKLIADMELEQTFRLTVLDAFFGIGVIKVCMADRGEVEAQGDVWYDLGQPWIGRVSPNDHVLDMTAKELTRIRFAGDRYRVPLKQVENESAYDPAITKKLVATSKHSTDNNQSRADEIANGAAVDDDELEPMLWLMDVWLPENGQVATLACDTDLPPLIVRDWTGTQDGPYKYLCLGNVPDNVIPSSPASNLKGLHDMVNRNYCKLRKMADGQKENPVYRPGGQDDADNYRKTPHGKYLKMSNPESIKVVKVGGVDPGLAAWNLGAIDTYDRMAGNLKAAAGLGAQADTLGQEEIIQGNMLSQMADLQYHVVKCASDVCWGLATLMWHDEFLEVAASREVAGTVVDSSWKPGLREGELDDYTVTVEPHSMIYQTPTQRLNRLRQYLNDIAPLWPMYQAQGAALDAEELQRQYAELSDTPEIRKLITFSAPATELGGDQNTVRQSPVTSRENVRRNIPTGGTAESRSAILQQVMMGGGQTTPQQRASLEKVPA